MERKYSKWIKERDTLHMVSSECMDLVRTIESNLAEKEGIFSEWSLKDLIAHIIGWEREAIIRYNAYLEGPSENVRYNINSFNKKSVASRKHLSWIDMLDELKSAQDEFERINCRLNAANINSDKRFESWIKILIKHYMHHNSQIKEKFKI